MNDSTARTAPVAEAQKFLERVLRAGPVLVGELYVKAEEEEISWTTIRRAREDIGVFSVKNRDGRVCWRLPDKNLKRAETFLRNKLEAGREPVLWLLQQAKLRHIPEATLLKAKDSVGAVTVTNKDGSIESWMIPGSNNRPATSIPSVKWLRAMLEPSREDGILLTLPQILSAATEAGITINQLYYAKSVLRVTSVKEGFPARVTGWSLPADDL